MLNGLISEVQQGLWPKNAWEGRPGSRYLTYRAYLETFRKDRLSEAGSQAADEKEGQTGQTTEKEGEPQPKEKEKSFKDRMMEQCQAAYEKHRQMTNPAQSTAQMPNTAQMPKGSSPAPPPSKPPGLDVAGGASSPSEGPPFKVPPAAPPAPPAKPASFSPPMPRIQEEKTEGTEGEPDNNKPKEEPKEEPKGEYGVWKGQWTGSWQAPAGWPQQNSWQNWKPHQQVAWLGDMN